MQDWDRVVMILVGIGVAISTGHAAWQHWRQRQLQAAVGVFLLAALTLALPLVLAFAGWFRQ